MTAHASFSNAAWAEVCSPKALTRVCDGFPEPWKSIKETKLRTMDTAQLDDEPVTAVADDSADKNGVEDTESDEDLSQSQSDGGLSCWGCTLTPGKPVTWDGSQTADEDKTLLVLRSACLTDQRPEDEGSVNVVAVTVSNLEDHPVISLLSGTAPSISLNIAFSETLTLKLIEGKGPVHIFGNIFADSADLPLTFGSHRSRSAVQSEEYQTSSDESESERSGESSDSSDDEESEEDGESEEEDDDENVENTADEVEEAENEDEEMEDEDSDEEEDDDEEDEDDSHILYQIVNKVEGEDEDEDADETADAEDEEDDENDEEGDAEIEDEEKEPMETEEDEKDDEDDSDIKYILVKEPSSVDNLDESRSRKRKMRLSAEAGEEEEKGSEDEEEEGVPRKRRRSSNGARPRSS